MSHMSHSCCYNTVSFLFLSFPLSHTVSILLSHSYSLSMGLTDTVCPLSSLPLSQRILLYILLSLPTFPLSLVTFSVIYCPLFVVQILLILLQFYSRYLYNCISLSLCF